MSDREEFFDEQGNEIEWSDSLSESELDEEEPLELRTVVLTKNDMVALLGLKTTSKGSMIIRVDPRQAQPAAQVYEDAESASRWFCRSLATSRRNGWALIYDGPPLFG